MTHTYLYHVLLSVGIVSAATLQALAQPSVHRIKLVNPSFEDVPMESRQPVGWQDCGFPGESAPDTQSNGFIFEVSQPPHSGKSYLGMVTRDNDTYERVGQRLSTPMEPGKTYQFSIWLCRSARYVSLSKLTMDKQNYTTPVVVRIWGGNGYCNRGELLGETSPVVNTDWMQYKFLLKPSQAYTNIMIEAYYRKGTTLPYNGNVLVDDASDLVAEDETIAAVTPKPEPKPEPKPQPKPQPKPEPKPEPTPAPATPPVAYNTPVVKQMPELNRGNLSIGKTLKVDKLHFKADSATISPQSYAVLDEIYQFLKANPDIQIEVGGHTNSVPNDAFCDKLSTARAKNVADYLISKGIEPNRITYKGYGKRKPIASNDTFEGRRANQRVEIKITAMRIPKSN